MIKELTIEEIMSDRTVYMDIREIMNETGVSKSTIHLHAQEDLIDGYMFKSKLFFKPDDVEKYIRLHDSGVLGRRGSAK